MNILRIAEEIRSLRSMSEVDPLVIDHAVRCVRPYELRWLSDACRDYKGDGAPTHLLTYLERGYRANIVMRIENHGLQLVSSDGIPYLVWPGQKSSKWQAQRIQAELDHLVADFRKVYAYWKQRAKFADVWPRLVEEGHELTRPPFIDLADTAEVEYRDADLPMDHWATLSDVVSVPAPASDTSFIPAPEPHEIHTVARAFGKSAKQHTGKSREWVAAQRKALREMSNRMKLKTMNEANNE